MKTDTVELPRTAVRSEQLVAASARATHDPVQEVDGDRGLDDSALADEFHHSTMCGEYIRRAGTPAYAPDRPVLVDGSTAGRALSYLLVLAVEEQLDHINRLTARDERVHPVSRQVGKLHVVEEARHVSFAKTYRAETWPRLDAAEQATVVDAALVAEIVSLMVNPVLVDRSTGVELGLTSRAA